MNEIKLENVKLETFTQKQINVEPMEANYNSNNCAPDDLCAPDTECGCTPEDCMPQDSDCGPVDG